MADAKRWTVTYTKHIKQKRKVYQDGALELHGSCEKVVLYDDCGKLLDSRFLKKDETVESGGTLTFDAYLVDIGELEEDSNPLKDLAVQKKDEKSIEKKGMLWQKDHCNSSENERTEFPSSGTSRNRSTFIKKIVAAYKKRELHGYKAIKSQTDATETSVRANKQIGVQNSSRPQNQLNDVDTFKEWHALYTAQISQKAKKYHDGTLRLSFCGSHQRQLQAMLYDDYGKLLASRLLKKDEVIESGAELAFDTHLTEIGEPKKNFKPQIVLNSEADKQSVGKNGLIGQTVGHNSSGGKLPKVDSPGHAMGSHSNRLVVDRFTCCARVPRDELLRDASQILSILKKPVATESLSFVNLQMEQTSLLQPSDKLQLGHQGKGQNALQSESSQVDAEENCDIQNHSSGDDTQIGPSRINFSPYKESQEISSFTSLIDPEHRERLLGDTLPASSITFPQYECPSDDASLDLLKGSSSIHNESILSESSSNSVSVLEVVKGGKPKQVFVDNAEPYGERREEAFLLGLSVGLSGPPGCAVASAEGEKTGQFESLSEKMSDVGDFPSFDLGI